MKRPIFALLTPFIVLSGCASPEPFYYKSGVQAEIITCSSNSWLPCLKSASATCGEGGYEILEKTSNKVSGFFTSSDYKEMIIVCKTKKITPPPHQSKEEKTPAIESSKDNVDTKNDMKSVGIDSVSPVNVEKKDVTEAIKATDEPKAIPHNGAENSAK